MVSKYKGTCSACGKYHIGVGDEIEKHAGKWAIPKCIEYKNKIRKLQERIQNEMLSTHALHCGVWDVPPNAKGIDTRYEYYKKALELGVCNEAEFNEMRRYFGIIWDRCLAD